MNPQNSPLSSTAVGGTDPGSRTMENTSTLAETKDKITQSAREAASKVKTVATNTTARAREEAARLATEKKEHAAGRLGGYGSALHDTARSLEEKDPNIAWFTHRAADKLQNVADYMRTRDLSTLKHDAEDLVRRHPAVFFGGLFLAGLVAGNLVKASRRNVDRDDYRDDEADQFQPSTESEVNQSDLTAAERSAAGI